MMRKVLPTADRVTLSTKGTTEWGICSKRPASKVFTIKINWTKSWDVIETWMLPHEYAHARAWGRIQAGMNEHDDHYYLELRRVDIAAETTWAHTEE